MLKLKKNIYGLKDAGRTWGLHLSDNLIARGFKQSQVDPCLFYKGDIILVVYVDDLIIFAPTEDKLDWVEQSFAKSTNEYDSFEFTNEGAVTAYLGIEVVHEVDGAIHLKQPFLIDRILVAMDAKQGKTHSTPAEGRLFKYADSEKDTSGINYRLIVGMMNYLAGTTRPDIAFAVHQCAQFCQDPRKPHFVALRRIARYLCRTKDKGLIMKPSKGEHSIGAYADADFAGDFHKDFSDDPSTAYS